jgi:hypothetical protein
MKIDNSGEDRIGFRLRMRPLRRRHGVAAVVIAAARIEQVPLVRFLSGRSLAVVGFAQTARVRLRGGNCERKWAEVPGKGEQQQKSGNRALHDFR